jgi:hypothetical protein
MPKLREESFGAGKQDWIGSPHGMYDTITCAIDISTFTAGTHYPNGYMPSGLALNVADEKAVTPWTNAAGEKLGFLYTDQPVVPASGVGAQDFGAPVFVHGIVKPANLPIPVATGTGDSHGIIFRAAGVH